MTARQGWAVRRNGKSTSDQRVRCRAMEIRALLDRMTHEGNRREVGDFVAEHAITSFDEIADVIATSDDGQVVRSACRAFTMLHAGDEVYLAATRHPHATVRRMAASMFRGEQALRHATELLPVLADEDHYVRREALWA